MMPTYKKALLVLHRKNKQGQGFSKLYNIFAGVFEEHPGSFDDYGFMDGMTWQAPEKHSHHNDYFTWPSVTYETYEENSTLIGLQFV